MGVASGGVFRTTDGGATLGADHRRQGSASARRASIAVADSDPNIIYLGTGSDGVRSNVSTGRGVYKSTDGGETWKFVGLYNAGQIGAVRIHPTNPEHRLGGGASATRSRRTPSAASSRRPTAARRGRRCSSSPTASARWTSSCSPAIRTSSTRGCRGSSASRGRSSAARSDGGFYKSTDGGEHFTKIVDGPADRADRQGQPRGDGGESESHLRARRGEAGRRALSLGRRGRRRGR